MEKSGFSDIFEELAWEMFKESGGNHYLIQEGIVQKRNLERERNKERTRS